VALLANLLSFTNTGVEAGMGMRDNRITSENFVSLGDYDWELDGNNNV
jgi:hypothetical protein